ncbi:hypothetical protein [Coraliomargarita parva]|uniref:hypothetical protein n=1 Tax=Coraliomargarita parva TaxID=3014050 RepID=UPI0022B5C881|nr:hypothetical protein [Coraliomargarita parva]
MDAPKKQSCEFCARLGIDNLRISLESDNVKGIRTGHAAVKAARVQARAAIVAAMIGGGCAIIAALILKL